MKVIYYVKYHISEKSFRCEQRALEMKQDINDYMNKKIKELGLFEGTESSEDILKHTCELIFEHSYDMISLLDKESVPIFVNKAHERILGYDKEALLGKPALELFHPEDIETAKSEWLKALEKKEKREKIQGRFKSKDGNYIWLETHLKTLTNEDGDVSLVLCISRDISDKVEAERKLKRNKEKVERLHDVAHELDICRTEDEVFDICMDAAKKILNFDYISTFKKVEDGFEAKAVSYEIKPKLKGEIYNKNNYTWQTYITGKSYLVNNIDKRNSPKAGLTEYKSGLSIPIGEYGVFQALSKEKDRYDEDDLELAELLVSHMNQTLKRLEYRSKLKESEERYRSIFENNGSPTMILDEDTTISMVNEEVEKLTGFSKDEIEGKMSFKDFLVKSEVEKVTRYHHVRRHEKDSVPSFYESKIVTKFGDTRDLLITVEMMPNSSKSIVSALDITNYKKNLRALSESEEAFRVVFDKSLVGMMKLDTELDIIGVNEKCCQLLGLPEEELLKQNFTDLVNKESVVNILKEVKNGKSKNFELDLENYDGGAKLNITADPITSVEQETKYILLQLM